MNPPEAGNDRAYIHEFIDIRGANRANYMHDMAANWSPMAQQDRNQLCFGIWAVVGTTGRWPQVCNIWEEPGLDGLARSLTGENVGEGLQDPKLERWWQEAAEFRRGGLDRVLLPAPWSPTIEESLTSGLRAEVCTHELIKVAPGTAPQALEVVRSHAIAAYEPLGWRLAGAWWTTMRDEDEIVVLWALPDSYQAWAAGEVAQTANREVLAWRGEMRRLATDWQRILLAAAPLCPWRTGRQPARDDRVDWKDPA